MRFSKQQTTYQSEITLFLNELKKNNPQLEEQQQKGRALLWDKAPINLDERQRELASTVPVEPN
jgi:hypothetical protein